MLGGSQDPAPAENQLDLQKGPRKRIIYLCNTAAGLLTISFPSRFLYLFYCVMKCAELTVRYCRI
jgi:hypothetical protein